MRNKAPELREALPRIPGAFGDLGPTFTRRGLEDLVTGAKDRFTEATGRELPYNLAWLQPDRRTYPGVPYRGDILYTRYNRDGRHRRIEGDGIVEQAARFAGWLDRITETDEDMALLIHFIERATSPNGVNSPHTSLDLWSFSERTRTPERAQRILRRVRWRANQILSPYGVRVSWLGLGHALSCRVRTGKAALLAARYTVHAVLERHFGVILPVGVDPMAAARGLKSALSASYGVRRWAGDHINAGEFSTLREALAHSGRLRRTVMPENLGRKDEFNGKELLLDPLSRVTQLGVSAAKVWRIEESSRYSVYSFWLVMRGQWERAYITHYTIPGIEQSEPDQAIEMALRWWTELDTLSHESAMVDGCPRVDV